MSKITTIPALNGENNLSRYLSEIRQFPMLSADEEFSYARAWRDNGDVDAAHKMVTSHLRLVAKLAMGYRGYGLPTAELVSEGNVGLMQAVKKFDPEKGFRLATYAMWWIKASIQEYILHSWSLVKIGTTTAQRKLFFNLRKLKNKMQMLEEGDLTPEHVQTIAEKLDVSQEDVVSMNRRMSGSDHSLNAPMKIDGEGEWQDWLKDDNAVDQEEYVAQQDEIDKRQGMLTSAMSELNEREQHILTQRRLRDEPQTLEELSQHYGISRERVRQIETRAFEKLQKTMRQMTLEKQTSTEAKLLEYR